MNGFRILPLALFGMLAVGCATEESPQFDDDRAQRIDSAEEMRNGNAEGAVITDTQDDKGADGMKLRGDGSVDDTQPLGGRGDDDIVGGVKLRGDGTVDDDQPGALDDDRRSDKIDEDDDRRGRDRRGSNSGPG